MIEGYKEGAKKFIKEANIVLPDLGKAKRKNIFLFNIIKNFQFNTI